MALKKVTVPDAGKSKGVNMTGQSVMIISAPSYASITDAPKLSFDQPGDNIPILPGGKWPNDECEFEEIKITGTEASAGDKIILLSLDICVQAKLSDSDLGAKKAYPGNSLPIDSTNAVQGFTELQMADADGNLPTQIALSASGNPVRFMINDGNGTDPDQAGTGTLIPVDADELFEIAGWATIQDFKFISAAADTHGTLIIHRVF